MDWSTKSAPGPAKPDRHGNVTAREGASRCECGCKYWEHDRCIDCGARHDPARHDDPAEAECEHGLSAWLCAGPDHYPPGL